MTPHEQVKDLLPGYALGALDAAEARLVAAHVPQCAECQAELAGFRRAVSAIGLSTLPEIPNAALKGRVMAHARGQAQLKPHSADGPAAETPAPSAHGVLDVPRAPVVRWYATTAGWALAASVVAAVASIGWALALRSELLTVRQMEVEASARAATLRDELDGLRSELARLDRAGLVVAAPDMLRVDLKGQDRATGAVGRALWSTTRGIVFSAERLPALDAGLVYQLWTIHNGKAVNAGVLRAAADGSISHSAPPPAGATVPEAVAVSIEPAGPPGGVAAPTGAIVMVGKPAA
jgi:hypothetical protein